MGAEEGSGSRPRGLRWTVGVAVAMWACGFFVARVQGATSARMSGASALFVVAFALPSYASLWRWAGRRRSLQVLGALGAFAMGIECLAVRTGWPYGEFSYGEAIGGKVAGLVPWTVPFAWTPLVLGTHALAHWMLRALRLPARASDGTWQPGAAARVAVATAALVLSDVVLDPGAVRQGFWRYGAGGAYYGVPASNYMGWVLSGLVGHALLERLLGAGRVGAGAQEAPPRGLAASLLWTLAFWSSVCAWAGMWVPAAMGHAYLGALWLRLHAQRTAQATNGAREGQ